MQKFLATSFLQVIPTLFIASLIIFSIIALSPGDPAAMRLGPEATDEMKQLERVRLGLDKPIFVRYFIWMSDAVQLKFGFSMSTGHPVTTLIADAFPNTLKLAVSSMVISVLLGTILGMISALQRNKPIDLFITSISSLGLSIPSFWLGILMIILFSVTLHWLPSSGTNDMDGNFGTSLKYLVMPIISIAFGQIAVFSRYTRSAMLDVLSADYIRTARAKGLVERLVISRHALRNALIPVVTIVGIQFARLLGGAVITEAVFAFSGIGRLVIVSILNRDYPVVQATLMIIVLIFVFTNLLVDISYGFLDPRVRTARSG
jgi:peptide/nickel transport system permease protein